MSTNLSRVGHVGKRLHQTAVGIFALGVASTVELLFTIEWSLPNCSEPGDGASAAIFGMPIPYERWAGSSLEYDFIPYVYLLNVILLFGATLPLARALVVLAARRWPRPVLRGVGLFGTVLCLGVLGMRALGLGVVWHPVRSIVSLPGESWRELRPIRATMDRHYQCVPSALSPLWFGSETQPRPAQQ